MIGIRSIAVGAGIATVWISAVYADALLDGVRTCRDLTDSLARLTCYDALKVEGAAASSPATPTTSAPAPTSSAPVTLTTYDLRLQPKNYRKEVFQDRVEFVPTFKNGTKKTVIGLILLLTITDAFGDKVVDGSSKLDIRIPPGKTVESDTFFFWEDNPFMNNEVYDKLNGPVGTGSAKAEVKVTRIVYSDGSVESF